MRKLKKIVGVTLALTMAVSAAQSAMAFRSPSGYGQKVHGIDFESAAAGVDATTIGWVHTLGSGATENFLSAEVDSVDGSNVLAVKKAENVVYNYTDYVDRKLANDKYTENLVEASFRLKVPNDIEGVNAPASTSAGETVNGMYAYVEVLNAKRDGILGGFAVLIPGGQSYVDIGYKTTSGNVWGNRVNLGEWVNLGMTFDRAKKVYTAYLNGKELMSTPFVSATSGDEKPGGFRVWLDRKSQPGLIYVDDLYLGNARFLNKDMFTVTAILENKVNGRADYTTSVSFAGGETRKVMLVAAGYDADGSLAAVSTDTKDVGESSVDLRVATDVCAENKCFLLDASTLMPIDAAKEEVVASWSYNGGTPTENGITLGSTTKASEAEYDGVKGLCPGSDRYVCFDIGDNIETAQYRVYMTYYDNGYSAGDNGYNCGKNIAYKGNGGARMNPGLTATAAGTATAKGWKTAWYDITTATNFPQFSEKDVFDLRFSPSKSGYNTEFTVSEVKLVKIG